MRTIAIGDIHGCLKALDELIELISPTSTDTIVFLGDYIDRGPASRGVIERVLSLENECNVIALRGNHEEMLLAGRHNPGGTRGAFWLANGGEQTAMSYGGVKQIPVEHIQFFRRCRFYYESDTHIFCHASYSPYRSMNQQDNDTLLWHSLRKSIPGPHMSGKIAVVGHTAHDEIVNVGHLVCIDTFCCGGGWLTGLDTASHKSWQVDRNGSVRR